MRFDKLKCMNLSICNFCVVNQTLIKSITEFFTIIKAPFFLLRSTLSKLCHELCITVHHSIHSERFIKPVS